MIPKEIHLKYEKYVFFTKAFVGSSNLYSKKIDFPTFRAAWWGWACGRHALAPCLSKGQPFL